MTIRTALWFVLCVFVASEAAAQATLAETMEVSIVDVDVFVTDKQGRRVRGLTKDDFELFENGAPRAISNFAEYSSDAATAGITAETPGETRAAAPPPHQKRTFVLFFERANLAPKRVAPLIASLKELLRRAIRPGDSLSLIFWSTGAAAQIDATDNLALAEHSLESLGKSLAAGRADETGQLRRDVFEVMAFQEAAAEFAASVGVIQRSPTAMTFQEVTELRAENAQMKAMLEMRRRVAAINATINTLSAVDGKKILLLATHRLGAVAGAEFVATTGLAPSFQVKNKYGTEELMKSVTSNANAAGVTIYPVYPAGFSEEDPGADDLEPAVFKDLGSPAPGYAMANALTLHNEVISLENIARETGGLTATGPQILDLLPRIEEDISDYYSLAYRVKGGRKDVARQIVVKTKNRDYVVRARRQFVEKTDSTRMKDRVVAALFRSSEEATIPIQAGVSAGEKTSMRRTTRLLRVRIPINGLTVLQRQDGKYAGSFSVYVASGARLEQVSDVTQKTQSFEIPASDLAKARAGHFTYDLELTVNPRAERVAVGVLDEVGKNYGVARVELK